MDADRDDTPERRGSLGLSIEMRLMDSYSLEEFDWNKQVPPDLVNHNPWTIDSCVEIGNKLRITAGRPEGSLLIPRSDIKCRELIPLCLCKGFETVYKRDNP